MINMVFKRKSRYPRKKKISRSTKSTRTIATKALKMVREIQPELKYNGAATGTTQSWIISTEDGGSGGLSTMCNIPQGTLSYERIGNKIKLERLDLRFEVVELGATNAFRIMVVQLKQQSSALAPAAILDGTSTAYCVQSRYDPENRAKYKILLDKTLVMGTTANRNQYFFRLNKKLSGTVEFQDSSSSAWGNIIQVVAWSQNASTSANSAVILYGGLYYSDA